jgi:hypothetical protein
MGLSRLNLFRDLDSLGDYTSQTFISSKEIPESPLQQVTSPPNVISNSPERVVGKGTMSPPLTGLGA